MIRLTQSIICALLILTPGLTHAQSFDQKAKRLHDSIENGQLEQVENLVKNRQLVNHGYPGGLTPLHYSVMYNRAAVAQILLNAGADPLKKNLDSVSTLDLAIEEGTIYFPHLIYEALSGEEQYTALMLILDGSVRRDKKDFLEFFIERVPRDRGIEPPEIELFFLAAANGSTECLNYFLEQGQDPKESDSLNQWTALHYAAYGKKPSLIQTLVDLGLEINATDKYGQTPITVAAVDGDEEVVSAYIQASADPNIADRQGVTPLHHAAYWGNEAIVRLLMKNGADVAALTQTGRTPLDFAVENGHAKLRTVFPLGAATGLTAGSVNDPAWTQLRNNVLSGDPSNIARLAASIDLNATDDQGFTLLHHASTRDFPRVIQALVSAGVDVNVADTLSSWTPLMMAVSSENHNTVKMLLMSGADVNHTDARGWTALHIANFNGDFAMLEILSVTSPDPKARNEEGQVPSYYLGFRSRYMHLQKIRGASEE